MIVMLIGIAYLKVAGTFGSNEVAAAATGHRLFYHSGYCDGTVQ